MIVDKGVIAEVLHDGLREIKLEDGAIIPATGSVLPLQAGVTNRATCYIRVNDAVFEEGGWTLRFDRAAAPDRARFLAADSSRGYTSDPSRAMVAEPEPVPEAWQEMITDAAALKAERAWNKIEPKLTRLAFEVRLRLCVEVAAFRRINVGADVYRIRSDKVEGSRMNALKRLERRVHRR